MLFLIVSIIIHTTKLILLYGNINTFSTKSKNTFNNNYYIHKIMNLFAIFVGKCNNNITIMICI